MHNFWCAVGVQLLAFTFGLNPSVAQNNIKSNRYSMDDGWRFYKRDLPFPVISGHGESYQATKAGVAPGAAAEIYDDTDWQQANVPHDWEALCGLGLIIMANLPLTLGQRLIPALV